MCSVWGLLNVIFLILVKVLFELFFIMYVVNVYGLFENLINGMLFFNLWWIVCMVFMIYCSLFFGFGIFSLLMLVLFLIGFLKCGFLLVLKYKFKFMVLGIVRIFENSMVVFSGKWCSGCRVILYVSLVFLYSDIKLLVLVCVVLYFGK